MPGAGTVALAEGLLEVGLTVVVPGAGAVVVGAELDGCETVGVVVEGLEVVGVLVPQAVRTEIQTSRIAMGRINLFTYSSFLLGRKKRTSPAVSGGKYATDVWIVSIGKSNRIVK